VLGGFIGGESWASPPKTSGTGADCTKLRFSRPTRAKYHYASKKPVEHSSLDPRELFETFPNDEGETDAIETTLCALQALKNCSKSNTKTADGLPELVKLFPD